MSRKFSELEKSLLEKKIKNNLDRLEGIVVMATANEPRRLGRQVDRLAGRRSRHGKGGVE